MCVNAGNPDALAIGVERIDQDIPSGRHDCGWHAKENALYGSQPFVAKAASPFRIRMPVCAQSVGFDRFGGDRIRRVDFQVLEPDRNIVDVDFRVYEHFEQCGSRVRRAIEDASAAGVPSSRGVQATGAIQRRVIAYPPENHAAMPWSI